MQVNVSAITLVWVRWSDEGPINGWSAALGPHRAGEDTAEHKSQEPEDNITSLLKALSSTCDGSIT